MGYTPSVQDLLAGQAEVTRPTRENGSAENCAGTNNGVAQLDRWLALDRGDWDVIHFNFGLHDLKRVQPDTGKNSNDPAHPHQADPARYERQLREITSRLQATGARLVFATTTPVPEGELRPYREPGDAVAYNRIALAVMEDAGVAVNDLFAFVSASDPPLSRPGDVHFSAEGSRQLGAQVVTAILEAAGRPD
jgi:acyl-CoA thioesterase-1